MSYIPVLVLLAAGMLMGGGMLVASHVLGPRLPNRMKNSPFECGFRPHQDARSRVSVRFYLVAILFLLFDVEVIFFFPWAVVYKKFLTMGSFLLIEMALFVAVLLVGYFYVLAKGALEWE